MEGTCRDVEKVTSWSLPDMQVPLHYLHQYYSDLSHNVLRWCFGPHMQSTVKKYPTTSKIRRNTTQRIDSRLKSLTTHKLYFYVVPNLTYALCFSLSPILSGNFAPFKRVLSWNLGHCLLDLFSLAFITRPGTQAAEDVGCHSCNRKFGRVASAKVHSVTSD